MEIVCDNIPHQYPSLLKYVLDNGEQVSPRGMKTGEVRGLTVISKDPTRRFFAHPHRRPNPVFPIAELMWYLSGDDSPAPLEHYVKSVRKYVNPKTGRFDGAYGPRLRRYSGKSDQIEALRNRLLFDHSSRRAVVAIFDPITDFDDSSLDIPCYALAQAFVRNERLELFVYARSQDMIRGFVYDTAEWQLFQDILSGWLNVELGPFTLFIASAHVYSSDRRRAAEIVDRDMNFDLYDGISASRAACSHGDFLAIMNNYSALDLGIRQMSVSGKPNFHKVADSIIEKTTSSFWKDAFTAIAAYNAFKFGDATYGQMLWMRIGNELKLSLSVWLKSKNLLA